MLQARWTQDGIEVVDEKPEPLREGWVRLRVVANGICGTDVHLYRREFPVLPGGVPGHELVATPMDGPRGLADALYAIEPQTWCGACSQCEIGEHHLCPEKKIFGLQLPGGMAQTIDVPQQSLHAVATGLDPVLASLSEPLAVVVRAIHLARLQADSRVLVLGAGTIGLLAALVARDRAARVAVSGRHKHQLKAAQALGVEAVPELQVGEWAQEYAPDVVIETVGGHADTLAQSVTLCKAGGRIVVLGVFAGARSLNALEFMAKELSMVGSNTYATTQRGSEFQAAVDLLPRLSAELSMLQTHRFPLEHVVEAFECATDKSSGAIKVTVLTS